MEAKCTSQNGSALILALIVLMIVAALSASMLSISTAKIRESEAGFDNLKAFYIAEAGINDAIAEISASKDYHLDGLGNVSGTFDGGHYTITAKNNGDRTWTLTAGGFYGNCSRSLQIIIAQRKSGSFQYLAFGNERTTVRGNPLCDSYDSAFGTYACQVNENHARSDGSVASNDDIVVSGTVRIYGNTTPGPEGEVIIAGTPYIDGSTCPAEEIMSVPTYSYLPVTASLGVLDSSTTLTSGTYRFSRINLMGNDKVDIGIWPGDRIVIYVDGRISVVANACIRIINNAVVEIHHGGFWGSDINIAGKSIVNESGLPANFTIFSACDKDVSVVGRSDFHGAILAPFARVKLAGNSDFYGAVVGQTVDIRSPSVHYDEALGYKNQTPLTSYVVKSWREIAN